MEEFGVEWQVWAIRGATTVSENTVEAIREAVMELLDEIQERNDLDPARIISATFTVTRDLDAIFPAAIARQRPYWDNVPMLDVQQMHVEGSLERCIRLLIHVNLPVSHVQIYHTYLREATILRPDWDLPQSIRQPQLSVQRVVESGNWGEKGKIKRKYLLLSFSFLIFTFFAYSLFSIAG